MNITVLVCNDCILNALHDNFCRHLGDLFTVINRTQNALNWRHAQCPLIGLYKQTFLLAIAYGIDVFTMHICYPYIYSKSRLFQHIFLWSGHAHWSKFEGILLSTAAQVNDSRFYPIRFSFEPEFCCYCLISLIVRILFLFISFFLWFLLILHLILIHFLNASLP